MRSSVISLALTAIFCTSSTAVTVGGTAPNFSLSTYGGGTFDLARQTGKVTVLFFLGCT